MSVAGVLVSTLASGVSTAVFTGGLSAFGAALYSLGIPKNSILNYETAIRMEKYLLIVHDTKAEVQRAADILATVSGVGEKEAEVAVYST